MQSEKGGGAESSENPIEYAQSLRTVRVRTRACAEIADTRRARLRGSVRYDPAKAVRCTTQRHPTRQTSERVHHRQRVSPAVCLP